MAKDNVKKLASMWTRNTSSSARNSAMCSKQFSGVSDAGPLDDVPGLLDRLQQVVLRSDPVG